MDQLDTELESLISSLHQSQGSIDTLSEDYLEKLYSVYPFNRYEFIIAHLIASGCIDFDRYLDMRNSYLERNKYLYIFEITAPRTFGENWAQRHLNELVPELQRPSKKLDPDYSGQYDFWLDGIRIEVKASRAVKRGSKEPLIKKALSKDSLEGFDMNFQQIKPGCCDVFIWIGVWRDSIQYWILSTDEVRSNKYYSVGQHRGNTGEGQLWLTEKNMKDFDPFQRSVHGILEAIRVKARLPME